MASIPHQGRACEGFVPRRSRDGVVSGRSAITGIGVDGLEVPGAAIGECELFDDPVSGLTIELVVDLDRFAGRVDPDKHVLAAAAQRDFARIQIGKRQRIDVGRRRRLVIDLVVADTLQILSAKRSIQHLSDIPRKTTRIAFKHGGRIEHGARGTSCPSRPPC